MPSLEPWLEKPGLWHAVADYWVEAVKGPRTRNLLGAKWLIAVNLAGLHLPTDGTQTLNFSCFSR